MSGGTGGGWPPSRDGYPVFVDRSMGRKAAAGMKVLGLDSVWIGEVYPNDGKLVPDVTWIHDAAAHGRAVITKDRKIVVNLEEFAAIRESGVKVFVVGNGGIGSVAMALILGRHWLTIRRRMKRPGGCLWVLHPLKPIYKQHG